MTNLAGLVIPPVYSMLENFGMNVHRQQDQQVSAAIGTDDNSIFREPMPVFSSDSRFAVTLGNPEITRTLLRAGVNTIGDSRIENIQRMRKAGIKTRFILIRTPLISKVDLVVEHADVSFNTELAVIEKLSQAAVKQKKTHQILLMIELGDLREGIPPEELDETVEQVLGLPGINLIGIGTNLACLGGIKPDHQKMKQLSDLAQRVEKKFNLTLEYVSGGNSANLEWFFGLGAAPWMFSF